MDDSELASLLAAHEARAVGYFTSEIADEQARAIDYYYGRMDGDVPPLDGCSTVADHLVAVMVDNALAAVLKPFVSADEVVAFAARGPEDQAQAEQATEYVNYVINCDNPGFLILHNWFKDALLTKIGVVKAWWEDRTQVRVRRIAVDAAQLEAARAAAGYLGEEDHGDGTFTVAVEEVVADGRVRIESVPPEEFLVSPMARSIEEAAYAAHRPSNYTRSDLVALGFDPQVVEGLPALAASAHEESRTRARYRDEEWYARTESAIGADRSRESVGVIDEYVRVDYDGDGVAELRRVIRAGDTILFNEPVEEAPFALICPCPMPHKIYGRGLADQAIEGQKISTALMRQTLDNLYKTNNPRPIVGEAALNADTSDDLQSTAPGAFIRVKSVGQIEWAGVPFTAQHSFPMLEYVARAVEERTGFQRKGQGFSAEALRKNSPDTATQAAIDADSRNERAEMIARIFAETGVKRLFALVLRLLVRHQPRARVIRLRNQWVPVDPSGWDPEMDLSISVGLGIGNRAEQVALADEVLATMAELQRTPYGWLVDAGHVHNALKRKLNAAGIKNVGDYLADPAAAAPPAPAAEPEAQLRAAELQARREEAALKLQLMREEAAAKLQLEREKAAAEIALARERMARETELERERMQLARGEAGLSAARLGGDLDK